MDKDITRMDMSPSQLLSYPFPLADSSIAPPSLLQVLEWGTAWLTQSDRASRAAAPDVALAVALARCSTAASAVAEGDSGALLAFQELEAAKELLGMHHVAPVLAAEIQGAMEVPTPCTAVLLS